MDVTVEALGLVVVKPENISVVPGTKGRFGLGILGMFLMTLLWVLGKLQKRKLQALLSRSPQTCFQSQLETYNINLHIKQEHKMLWQHVQHN